MASFSGTPRSRTIDQGEQLRMPNAIKILPGEGSAMARFGKLQLDRTALKRHGTRGVKRPPSELDLMKIQAPSCF
jgi:hypothetical protein